MDIIDFKFQHTQTKDCEGELYSGYKHKLDMLEYCSLKEWNKTLYLGIEYTDYFLCKSPMHLYKGLL